MSRCLQRLFASFWLGAFCATVVGALCILTFVMIGWVNPLDCSRRAAAQERIAVLPMFIMAGIAWVGAGCFVWKRTGEELDRLQPDVAGEGGGPRP